MAEQRRGPRPADAAIVGMGAVFPGAADLAAYRRNLIDGVDAITDVPPARWDPGVYYDPNPAGGPARSDRFYCRRGGFIDDLAAFDPTRFGIMPAAVAGAEPDQLIALRVIAEAIADAGGEERLPADRSRIGVILGRGGFMGVATARLDQRVRTAHQLTATLRDLAPELGEDRIAAVREAFQDSLGAERPEASIGLVPSFTAARTANRLDLRGPAYTIDAACASALLAVGQASDLLAAGRCDLVVAGAVHHCHIATLWSVFTQLRALSPSQHIRPFDRRADGTLLSEGTGVVLLKRLADAERDGDRIYAVVRGVGTAGDGRAASLMSPLVDGQIRALEQAWRHADLDPTAPAALGLLEAHGTGTPVGDEAELATLARVFGPRAAGSEPVGLGSVKSMLGHTMQASGMAGLIKAVLAVHEGALLPTLHLDEPHESFARTRMRPVTAAEPWERRGPRRAGVNAFGFGGINAHAVLEETPGAGTAQPFAPPAPDESVVLLAAATPGELARRLTTPHDLEPAAAAADRHGPCRLALIGPTPKRRALAAKVVARGLPWRGRGDVWFTPSPLFGPHATDPDSQLAFLFPGLEPDFTPHTDDVADHFKLPRPALSGGSELLERAVDAIAVGRLLAGVLRALEIRPDLLAGHSLGEWTAMVVAGMYPREAVDTFLDSLRPGTLDVPDLLYAALGCGAERAADALRGLDQVVVSHDNCPHQSVLCGEPQQVREAVSHLAAQGVPAQELPFRSGFHTPMWEPYLGQVRAAFDRLPPRAPTVPVWSATTGRPYPAEPEGVRQLVLRHLLEPVRFQTLTHRLYEEKVRAFVTMGPGSLSGFVEDTLRGRDHLVAPAASPRHSGLGALCRLAAALWTEGLEPRWDRLAQPRSAVRTDTGHRAERTGRPVLLDLGSPLIRLGTAAPTLTPIAPTGRTANRPALLSALDAVLGETDATARAVAAAWRGAAHERPPAVPAPVADAVGQTRPPDAEETAPGGNSAHRTRRLLSLETLPCVRDHCVYLQPENWPEPADRFPVVPMTTLLELAAEAAQEALHGRGAVVGFSDVRALRWLAVAPPAEVLLEATPVDRGRVRVAIGDCATVTVHTAARYPAPPAPSPSALTREGPPPVSAEALYRDRWMFHGLAFAGVRKVSAVGDDGIRGVLCALPAPGALLDAAGQLLGHWMQLRLPADRLVFPASLERVRLYGPPPREGALLHATARVRAVRAASVRGDVELTAHDGIVWARLEGWTYRRFAADERVWPMKFTPEVCGIGEPQPGGWCLARRRWGDPASQELVMRRYLDAAERTAYEQRPPRTRTAWLLGRIAAKDALRQLLWDRGAGPLFPVEVPVGNDDHGRPRPRGPIAAGSHLSLAHKERIAVAMAHPTAPVGIDVETITDDPAALSRIALTSDERRLAEQLAACDGTGRAQALTMLWCAKEAAAKAEGTGLGGRLREWTVTAAPGGTGLRVTSPDGRSHLVQTRTVHDLPGTDTPPRTHVVAWTVPPTTTLTATPTRTEASHGV
ncbi:type I polyketide synthase [Streptomyces gobiensis]|uniref:type I polyketide synthase n=1 Tax=Streptomyces gobiensis TaxID=2875706 RepID=UPI001E456A59|nr:type I polyketide synthase [Streptomyces gobiensis]UGY94915.1 polyketide synthase dehydratase domain-containing protein [Streptomyces gobiensis]